MSYVHPFSKRCDKSEVDLFRVPPTQQSLERGRWIDYAPLSSVENANSAITFLIAGTDEYIDLSRTILTVTGKITKKDGESKLDGNDQSNVAPVNNFLHSLFRQVDVYLNGKQVTPAMGTYAYRSYIETLLNYDVSAKQSQFSSALYYKDTPGQMEKVGALASSKTLNYKTPGSNPGDVGTDASDKLYVPESGNVGFAKRHQFIKNGNRFVLSGPIFADIFMTDRLLLNMMDLKVVLNRSSDAFCLFEKGNDPAIEPKVQLSDVVLKVRKVKVDQSISDGVERMLKQTPALYPIRRVECKILTIPANLPNVRQDNIFSGIIPNSFVVGLVHVDATTGEYDKNPYNFQHFGVTSVSLTANGQEIPFKLLTLKYPKDADGKIDPANDTELDFDEAYNTLFSGTGKIYSNAGLDITREDKRALERNPSTKKIFGGVFAADELPKTFDTFPYGFVANTDPSTEPGTHWVAFYFPSRDKGEFFDSYGYPPEHYGLESYEIETWNKYKLQSSWSNVCGQYCIFYLYRKSRGYSMSKIVNLFTDSTSINDCNVACYVKKHFNVVVVENQPVCGLNQCCKPLMK